MRHCGWGSKWQKWDGGGWPLYIHARRAVAAHRHGHGEPRAATSGGASPHAGATQEPLQPRDAAAGAVAVTTAAAAAVSAASTAGRRHPPRECPKARCGAHNQRTLWTPASWDTAAQWKGGGGVCVNSGEGEGERIGGGQRVGEGGGAHQGDAGRQGPAAAPRRGDRPAGRVAVGHRQRRPSTMASMQAPRAAGEEGEGRGRVEWRWWLRRWRQRRSTSPRQRYDANECAMLFASRGSPSACTPLDEARVHGRSWTREAHLFGRCARTAGHE